MDFKIEVPPQPPYSPDLLSTDYHLYRSLNRFLKKRRFGQLDDVKNAFKEFVHSRGKSFYSRESTHLYFIGKSVLMRVVLILSIYVIAGRSVSF